jgi:hypothetical protein
MIKKSLSCCVIMLLFTFLIGCAAHTHIIGTGPQGNETVSAKQWYAVYGLASLNKVDTREMAGGATNYEIDTKASFLDAVISGILAGGLISCRSVTVKK